MRFSDWIVVPYMAALIATQVAAQNSPVRRWAVNSGSTASQTLVSPVVQRPQTTPCVVSLFSNLEFADFSSKTFEYTPPAACPGPWSKVVLTADFNVTAGVQFDRTAQIFLGHANIYYGTTEEPSLTIGPAWHIERDLTDYGSLFTAAQSGEVDLGNLVNSTYTGIIYGSAEVELYPASSGNPTLRAADAVFPMPDAAGGAVALNTTADQLSQSFTLPTNIEAAYLDVITQSQSGDEFWYTCVPNDVTSELESCGNTAFREGEISIDGQPAGVAPVYPWIYTGGIDPYLWQPIPGVQALNFVPYRVNLTPFAGVLSNGQPHTIALSVYNADSYFLATASLLVYLDHGSTQVTGAVTQNTIGSAPDPSVQEHLTTDPSGNVIGTVAVQSARQFTLEGYVNTSHGKVDTEIVEGVNFLNKQKFLIDASQYIQDITQATSVTSNVTTTAGSAVLHGQEQFSYPLTVDITETLSSNGNLALHTSIQQTYDADRTGVGFQNSLFDQVEATDTLLLDSSFDIIGNSGQQSAEQSVSHLNGNCQTVVAAAADGVITQLKRGSGCPK